MFRERCDLCHLAFGEFRHDSAIQASLVALAAPSLDVFERCVELIAEHRQVVVEFLACDAGINLGGHDIGVSQYTAHTLDRHSF